ncbi:MAG: hypothetical protein M5U01_22065 [Ardenticatenaceae bacterium]|nr:hypothetical protein [Ardenticatenaceae bacterium]
MDTLDGHEEVLERRGAVLRRGVGWWVKHGAIGGLIAGIIFAMFEMIVAP